MPIIWKESGVVEGRGGDKKGGVGMVVVVVVEEGEGEGEGEGEHSCYPTNTCIKNSGHLKIIAT
jgi:hypothetical protein